MSPKAAILRSVDPLDTPEMPAKNAVSCNGCSNAYPNRIQTQLLGERELARFWGHVNRAGAEDCWLWTGSVNGSGRVQHGQFTIRVPGHQYHWKAHRVAWTLTRGEIPAGVMVCHHCDVPRCCNPDHLFLGTQADNLKDAARKHRFHAPRTKKLTLAQRLAIFAVAPRRGILVDLARQYGVTKTAILHIRRGRFVGAPQQALSQNQPVQTQGGLRARDVVPQSRQFLIGEVR